MSISILVRSPEITLKKRNQGEFWAILRENLKHVLERSGIDWPIRNARARLEIDAGEAPDPTRVETALALLSEVPGVDAYAAARRLEPDAASIRATVVALAREHREPGRSFAVRANRVDKRFPVKSTALEIELGDAIRNEAEWERVDLDRPDRTFYVDIYRENAFAYVERLKGVGGLPVGMSGRVLSLLSGGIDSPVASYLLARRGASIDWFHMSVTHPTERDFEASVVGRIARRLSRYTLRSRLYIVPYTRFDLALQGDASGYEPVLFRRFLFRAAEKLARRIGADALGAGDSLAQVASQTMENLIATNKAVDALVLRPLVGLDKQEIMALAKRVGTYETSIEPYKDCCALYARRVRTRTRDRLLTGIEKRLLPDYQSVIDKSLGEMMWAEYDCGEVGAVYEPSREPASAQSAR